MSARDWLEAAGIGDALKQAGPKLIVDEPSNLGSRVAEAVAVCSRKAIAARGSFCIAIAGGSLVKMLGSMASLEGIEWEKWHVAWVDERCVPHDHAESNYGGALSAWLSKVKIPASQIYPIKNGGEGGGLPAAQAAADEYEERLKAVGALPRDSAGLPVFDLLLLGFGPDGHICSLFPGHPLLGDQSGRWILPIGDSPKPPPERITLSLGAVNAARAVVLVGAGASKAEPVAHVFGPAPEAPLPCALGIGAGPTPPLWLIDTPAASGLPAAQRAATAGPVDFAAHFC